MKFYDLQYVKNAHSTYFIELQYCRLPVGTDIKTIVDVSSVGDWRDDSIYVHGDDDNEFYEQYGKIFTGGVYGNLERGEMDLCGINFYDAAQAARMRELLSEAKPPEYQTVCRWLDGVRGLPGFYILGL